jgi:hypothetical protein
MTHLLWRGRKDPLKNGLKLFDPHSLPAQGIMGHFIRLLQLLYNYLVMPTSFFELGEIIAPSGAELQLRSTIAFAPFLGSLVQGLAPCLAFHRRSVRRRLTLAILP